MPFAWSARPLAFNEGKQEPHFPYVYKQEGAKLSDEHMLNYLASFKKFVFFCSCDDAYSR